jgi:DNA-binding SARP family transcriptional activator
VPVTVQSDDATDALSEVSAMSIQLRVLGCFGLSVDGLPVEISPVPARILAFLALHRDGVARSTLAGVLWPDVMHGRALGNLRSALWRLPGGARHAVTECGASLRLAGDVQCDLDQIEVNLMAQRGVPDVLAWGWQDELLAGWYDDWVLVAREELQLRRAVLLERLSAGSCARGQGGDALLYATLAVAAQPLRESAHRALLRAHLHQGNRLEVVELFRELASMLRRELDVAPSPETTALIADTAEAVA